MMLDSTNEIVTSNTNGIFDYELIDGNRKNSKIYIIDSFFFYKSRSNLTCQMRLKTGCPASGKLLIAQNKVKLHCSNHNHEPQPLERENRALKLKLKVLHLEGKMQFQFWVVVTPS